MSAAELTDLRSQIDRHLTQRKSDLEKQIVRLDDYVRGGRRNRTKGIKVPPKFRGPKGETWAGRGVHPTWLAALLKAGHKIEEYAIGAAKAAAAARKKVARKVAKKPRRKGKSRMKRAA